MYFVGRFSTQFQQREALTDVLPSQVIKCINRDTNTEKLLNYSSMI